MQGRESFSVEEITSADVQTLTDKVQHLAKEYENLNANAWFSYRDNSLTPLTYIEPHDENSEPPKRAYYQILQSLHDQLRLVRYPEKESIIQLQALLKSELTAIKETVIPDETFEIESALFKLFLHTYTQRKRDDIDEEYLLSLINEIHDEARCHKELAITPSEINACENLGKLKLSETLGANHFAQYHALLSILNQNRALTPAFNALLLYELQLQAEANWQPQVAKKNETDAVTRALTAIEEHTLFASSAHEEFAEKWGLSASDLRDVSLLKSWNSLCEEQGWHIEADHDKELAIAARHLLGLDPNFTSIIHQNCYVLQNGDAQIKLFEKEAFELKKMITLQDGIKQSKQKLQALKAQPNINNEALLQLNKMLANQEERLTELRQSTFDPESELENKNQQLIDYQYRVIKNELPLLQQNLLQLKMWSPRNLTILFTDHIIDGQIQRLENPTSIDNLTVDFEKMLKRISAAYYQLLVALRDAHELIQHELHSIKRFFEDHHRTYPDSPLLPSFMLETIDPEYEQTRFTNVILQHLAEFTEASDFYIVKKLIRYDSPIYPGVVLPTLDEVKRYVPMKAQPIIQQKLPRARFIKHAHLTLTSLDHEKPPALQHSLTFNLLFGMAVGVMFALLAAGIVAALVFTGGLLAVPLTTLAIAGIFGGLGLGGALAGLIGGGIYSYRHSPNNIPATTPALNTTALTTATLALNRPKEITSENNVSLGDIPITPIITSQPNEVLPDAQNLQTPPALTRSASPH